MRKAEINSISGLMAVLMLMSFCVPMFNSEGTKAKASTELMLNYMEKGEDYIRSFYNPNSPDYFLHRVNGFFTDENLARVQKQIEKVARERGLSTKKVMFEVTAKEARDYVFEPLVSKLANLQMAFDKEVVLNATIIDKPGVSSAVFVGTGALVATLGVSAVTLGAWGAMNATVTSLWAAFIVYYTGASIGMSSAVAAILAGPWGWIVLAGLIVSVFVGYGYYQRKAGAYIQTMKTELVKQIEAYRAKLVASWRRSFSF